MDVLGRSVRHGDLRKRRHLARRLNRYRIRSRTNCIAYRTRAVCAMRPKETHRMGRRDRNSHRTRSSRALLPAISEAIRRARRRLRAATGRASSVLSTLRNAPSASSFCWNSARSRLRSSLAVNGADEYIACPSLTYGGEHRVAVRVR